MEKNHVTPEGAMIRIKDASYQAPFHPGLEFNSPVHGNRNVDAGDHSDICLCR